MLDDSERTDYYACHGIPAAYIGEIERMRRESPARKVGKSALTNTVTYLFCRVMQKHLICESRTCEALGFMKWKHEQLIREIYCQVRMMRVERFSAHGHRTVGPMICDAMVYTPRGIVFLECKYSSELEILAQQNPREWIKTDSGWTRPAVERWARERGCTYQIYTPPDPHGMYWANLEVLYPLIGVEMATEEERTAKSMMKQCEVGPLALSDLLYGNQAHAMRVALLLLANRMLFGTLCAGLLDQPDSIIVGTDRSRIELLNTSMLDRVRQRLDPIDISDPVLRATPIDLKRGQDRLDRVYAMIAGEEPVTRKFRPLILRVKRARSEGRSALAECITNFHQCGSTDSKLSPPQIEAIDHIIKTEWDSGKVQRQCDLYVRFARYCEVLGMLDVPSKTALRSVLKKRSTAKHDINTGGNRKFHSRRPPSDPTDRSVRSIARFHLAHIDSTRFDHRSASTTCPEFPFSCPTLYCCIDQASHEILGRSLTFGPPSRFGLALLFRDILRRHGQLPLAITADRGSDMWSDMVIALALQFGITLNMRPAGASRYGSAIEKTLGEVNSNVAHRLAGSTLPDQKGRSVDGKYKSYRTARLTFDVVVQVVDYFLFEVWPGRPFGELGQRPNELREALSQFGTTGIPVAYDTSFEIATSVPIQNSDWRTIHGHSIRAFYRGYTSTELTLRLRERGKPDEVRLDCADPTMCYVKFGREWIRAFHKDVFASQVSNELDRIFSVIYTRDMARLNRSFNDDALKKTLDRVDLANASVAATHDVQPSIAAEDDVTLPSVASASVSEVSGWDFDFDKLPTFEDSANE